MSRKEPWTNTSLDSHYMQYVLVLGLPLTCAQSPSVFTAQLYAPCLVVLERN
jgi:hypothetical protein